MVYFLMTDVVPETTSGVTLDEPPNLKKNTKKDVEKMKIPSKNNNVVERETTKQFDMNE